MNSIKLNYKKLKKNESKIKNKISKSNNMNNNKNKNENIFNVLKMKGDKNKNNCNIGSAIGGNIGGAYDFDLVLDVLHSNVEIDTILIKIRTSFQISNSVIDHKNFDIKVFKTFETIKKLRFGKTRPDNFKILNTKQFNKLDRSRKLKLLNRIKNKFNIFVPFFKTTPRALNRTYNKIRKKIREENLLRKLDRETYRRVKNPFPSYTFDTAFLQAWFNGIGQELNFFHVEHIDNINTVEKKTPLTIREKFNRANLDKVSFVKLPYNINANNMIYKNNCVEDYIIDLAKKNHKLIKTKKFIKNINMKWDGVKKWTVEDLIELCQFSKIDYKFVDRTGKVQAKKKFTENNNKKKVALAMVANKHLYPLEPKELTQIRKFKTDDFIINNILYYDCDKINEFVNDQINNKGAICYKFTSSNNTLRISQEKREKVYIERILLNDVLYTTDEQLVKTYNFFKKHIEGFEEIIPYNISSSSFIKSFLDKFNCQSLGYSFLNNPSPIVYYRKTLENEKNIKCIDKNKMYTHCLKNLDYIPRINFYNEIKDYDDHEIEQTNFYFVSSIKINTYGIIKVGWNSGYLFNNIKDICKYIEIKKYLKPDLIENPLKNIINELYEYDPKLTKHIINHFIGFGSMDRQDKTICVDTTTHSTKEDAERMIDDDENYNIGYYELYDNLFTGYKVVNIKANYDNSYRPLSYYVLDSAKNLMLKTMIDMRNKDKFIKIVKIKTDSISFISTKDIEKEYINNTIDGWKYEKFKKQNSTGDIYQYNKGNSREFMSDDYENIKNFDVSESGYFNCWAGSGKSYFIKNTIVPKLKELKKSYIVLGAQHSVLTDYRNDEDINNKTIQKHNMEHKTQYYDTYIIDEAGLCDYSLMNNFFKKIKKNATLFFLGDSRQCIPVLNKMRNLENNTFNNDYLRTQFKNFYEIETNYRNNYSVEDYRKMLKGKYKLTIKEKKLLGTYRSIKLYEKHKKDNSFNPYIVCFTNKIKDTINEIFTDDWKNYDDKKIKKSGLVTYRDQRNTLNKRDIYNNMVFIIKDYNENEVTLKTYDHETQQEHGEDYKITKIEYINYFIPAYCFTLYKTQGKSIPYNIYGILQWSIIRQNPNDFYTCLSRIKEDIIKKDIIKVEPEPKTKNNIRLSDLLN